MTELEKYELVNKCETIEQLANAIRTIANDSVIVGRTNMFESEKMASRVKQVVENDISPNVLTRMYNIRQQALYLRYYLIP